MNIPARPPATIGLTHGAGSRAMRELIETLFLPSYSPLSRESIGLERMDDGAAIRLGEEWLVITTDSHVIKPIFFPGGDIGRLAVAGTVNDLAMMGATEILGLTCAVVLEEGFPRAELRRIQDSIRDTCAEAGVTVVAGDTKVMGRGELDGILLNTSGVGLARRAVPDDGLEPGDRILVTGSVGDHGLAVVAARNELDLEGELRSDVAPLNHLVERVLDVAGENLVAMKDPTRGGLSSTLSEMARKANVGILLDEQAIPRSAAVRAASELLGIDPLQVANEGKALLGVRPAIADRLLATLQAHPLGRQAAIIGTAIDTYHGAVILETGFGRRFLTELEGDPLPRIC